MYIFFDDTFDYDGLDVDLSDVESLSDTIKKGILIGIIFSVDKLLMVLRTETCFSYLPKTYKTFLGTLRKVNTIPVNHGRYYGFNLLDVITASLDKRSNSKT